MSPSADNKLAVVLIRGRIGLHRDVKHTLDLLRLKQKHACVLIKDDEAHRGMLKRAKDAITWGTIAPETEQSLMQRRTSKETVYHLSPPRGGFERKGIKQPYGQGGALGDRKERMDDLVKRMIA